MSKIESCSAKSRLGNFFKNDISTHLKPNFDQTWKALYKNIKLELKKAKIEEKRELVILKKLDRIQRISLKELGGAELLLRMVKTESPEDYLQSIAELLSQGTSFTNVIDNGNRHALSYVFSPEDPNNGNPKIVSLFLNRITKEDLRFFITRKGFPAYENVLLKMTKAPSEIFQDFLNKIKEDVRILQLVELEPVIDSLISSKRSSDLLALVVTFAEKNELTRLLQLQSSFYRESVNTNFFHYLALCQSEQNEDFFKIIEVIKSSFSQDQTFISELLLNSTDETGVVPLKAALNHKANRCILIKYFELLTIPELQNRGLKILNLSQIPKM